VARLEDFYRWDGPRPEVVFGGRRCRLPLWYHDNEFTSSLHTADHDAVAAELPSDLLRPARWVDGRALVSVAAFRYRAVTVDLPGGGHGAVVPYGEVSVAALVTRGPAMRLLPVLRPRVQVFVLHLPVTSAEARDGGDVWGFPKFVADIDFVEAPARREVTVSEDGLEVLHLAVRPSGPALPDHQPHTVFSAAGGRLLETVVPMSGYRQVRLGGGAGRLELGPHPVGRRLTGLDVSPAPVALFNYLEHRSILPAGVPVGPAGEYRGYAGAERPFGRYTVRYPGTPPLDVYAPSPLAGLIEPDAATVCADAPFP
jgi:Acetoacetate decarboxylase (ADC)